MSYSIFNAANVSPITASTTYTLSPGLNNSVNTVLSVTGSNYPNWTSAPTTQSTLTVSGDTKIEGNLTVKGRDLCELLDSIESRLAILRVNPELEAEFNELKELGDQYRKLEAKFKEQKRVFEILKTQDQ
jgi:hypothetical protein